MPHAIVKQPDGLYAIWSSVVDDFLLLSASAEEAIAYELDDKKHLYPGGIEALRADLCKEFEHILATGRAWKWAPTWDEAMETIRELHGEETHRARLAAVGSGSGSESDGQEDVRE